MISKFATIPMALFSAGSFAPYLNIYNTDFQTEDINSAYYSTMNNGIITVIDEYNLSMDDSILFYGQDYFIREAIDLFKMKVDEEDFEVGEEIKCLSWFREIKNNEWYGEWFSSLMREGFRVEKEIKALLYLLGQFNFSEINENELIFVSRFAHYSEDLDIQDYALRTFENWNSKVANERIKDAHFSNIFLQRRFKMLLSEAE